MSRLHIYDRRERALVNAADGVLGALAGIVRPFRRRRRPETPRRVLLLRLERIGDLLMALPAIRDVRGLAPSAEIDLVVGGWNAALARAAPSVTRVETLDAGWLTRGGEGLGMASLLRRAVHWRRRRYDLAVNFEPDVRSNLLIAAAGAAWTAGWRSGGGGPALDQALQYDPTAHTTDNARRLVSAVFDRPAPATAGPLLAIPESATRAAIARLPVRAGRPLVGIHVSGGRAIKQWDLEKFASVAQRLTDERDATIVFTGDLADRAMVDAVKAPLRKDLVIDVVGEDLLMLAALVERLDLLITGDTGPMHLAAVVGTPVVAVFGPSVPARYFPAGPRHRLVRVDLPCSPCNRIRLPPARCLGHTPDCLAEIPANQVFEAAAAALAAVRVSPNGSLAR